jgi:hypothetical protein
VEGGKGEREVRGEEGGKGEKGCRRQEEGGKRDKEDRRPEGSQREAGGKPEGSRREARRRPEGKLSFFLLLSPPLAIVNQSTLSSIECGVWSLYSLDFLLKALKE